MAVITILVLSLGLAGCAQPRDTDSDMTDRSPQLDADGQHRSLALDTPLLAYLREQDDNPRGAAWYDGRSDRSLGAVSGYELPVVQRSVTYTRDQQYQHFGHVHDNYSSTTYRSEYRELVR
jgi:hypothetical protein